jgi:aspartate/methionine/tyrosine aminotransferase
MPSTQSKRESSSSPFDEQDYTTWIRNMLRQLRGEATTHVLFDSTIREPTDLLVARTRAAFTGELTDRYQGVFVDGNPFVVVALAKRYSVDPAQILCTTGATSGMAMVMKACLQQGGHVLVETPCFDLLPLLATEAGGDVEFVPRRQGNFTIDPADLARRIRHDTKLIVLTNLHNPSGVLLGEDAMRALGAVARAAGVLILVDEVYADFAPDHHHRPAALLGDEFITVGSLTKVFGLTALKCGWIIGDPARLKSIRAAHPGELGLSRVSHAIAALVLEDMDPFEAHWCAVLAENRPVLEVHAKRMREDGLIAGELPAYGCVYFPELVGVPDTRALAAWLWDTHRILVAPGEFFGRAGSIRIGFGGKSDALDRGLPALGAALRAYRDLKR